MLKILETKVHLQPIHYLRLTDSLGIHIIVHVYRHCTIHQAVSSGATLLLVWCIQLEQPLLSSIRAG